MKKQNQKYLDLIDKAHEYMKQWIDSENWCDLSVMLEHQGDTILAAYTLCNAGAIDSTRCVDEAKEIEKFIEKLARGFRKLPKKKQSKQYHETFKTCFIADCQDCNHVSFVDDGNEELYESLKTECWQCKSTNIETKRGLK